MRILGKFLVLGVFVITSLYAEVNAQKLYRKCAGCHGQDGAHAPYERETGILKGRTQEELKIIMTMIRNGEYKSDKINNIMRKAIKKFSDKDIDVVSEYISHL